ncbi:unnamed protein product [Protopolystoma xenopodis]|uniref:Uncharacterized protein n=1 Tax=Protopolystoma xenopodis TaxID=117903 RepID=A0A3S5AGT4_9PLAT|nr:unnamed protein product [Protopolystoma xenopodis]
MRMYSVKACSPAHYTVVGRHGHHGQNARSPVVPEAHRAASEHVIAQRRQIKAVNAPDPILWWVKLAGNKLGPTIMDMDDGLLKSIKHLVIYLFPISLQVRACSSADCAVDGAWGPWSWWSHCSRSCGGGQRRRMRQCNSPSPAFGGVDCGSEADGVQSEDCNMEPCPGRLLSERPRGSLLRLM